MCASRSLLLGVGGCYQNGMFPFCQFQGPFHSSSSLGVLDWYRYLSLPTLVAFLAQVAPRLDFDPNWGQISRVSPQDQAPHLGTGAK